MMQMTGFPGVPPPPSTPPPTIPGAPQGPPPGGKAVTMAPVPESVASVPKAEEGPPKDAPKADASGENGATTAAEPAATAAGAAKEEGTPTDKAEKKEEAKEGTAEAPAAKAEEANSKPAAAPEVPAKRKALIRGVFNLCDGDGDGVLSEREMLRLAVQTGFEGTASKWSEEYKRLCTDNGREPAKGIDIETLEKLLNDSKDGGEQYTSDEELQNITKKLESGDSSSLLMAARAAVEASNNLGKVVMGAPGAVQLAQRMQTPKAASHPVPHGFGNPMPRPHPQIDLRWNKVVKPAPRACAPFQGKGGQPFRSGGGHFGGGKGGGGGGKAGKGWVVPPPSTPPPIGHFGIQGVYGPADDGLMMSVEGSSPKGMGGAPPMAGHFSKSSGVPGFMGDGLPSYGLPPSAKYARR